MNPHRPAPRLFSLLMVLALLVGSALAVKPVSAAGIVVNSAADTEAVDGVCTLREALIAANTGLAYNECAAGSAITFAGDYTITLNGAQLPKIETNITITGNGAAKTIIQASTCNPVTLPGGCTPATHRVFEVAPDGNLTLHGVTVRHGYREGGSGGGILNDGTLTLTNSTISGNRASSGGGIVNDGTLTLTNSTLSGNIAYHGGGIYNNDYGLLIVTSSTFSGNYAHFNGAGIFNAMLSLVNLTNSTLSANSAGEYGGGIFNGIFADLSLTNSTLSGNTAGKDGGGIVNYFGTLNYKNTIIAHSTGGDCFFVDLDYQFTGSHNLVTDGSCGGSNENPMLGPLANNGGPTHTHALLPGSPAIDAGDSVTCAASPVNNLDQRGVTRPYGVGCDIGAFESHPGYPSIGFIYYLLSIFKP